MRTLILMLFFISTSLVVAQDKSNESSVLINDQTIKWMTIIASDSDMRTKMMDMMIKETHGNEVETTKLVNLMINDREINSIIFSLQSVDKEHENMSIEPRGMMQDSVKSRKMYKLQPMNKK